MGRASAVPMPLYTPEIQPRRGGIVGILRDVFRGALLGDFAIDLGLMGAITQVALAYTPVVGDICAIRDMVGDLYHKDKFGFLLSALALVPVLGGIAKTIDVIHNSHRVGRALIRSRQRHARLNAQRQAQLQVQLQAQSQAQFNAPRRVRS